MNTLEALNKLLDHTNRPVSDDLNAISDRFGTARHLQNLPRIECKYGLSLSVQASAYHYCSPRDSVGPWSSVEVGFPSHRVEDLMPYIDGAEGDDPTGTVYGCVPIDLVAKIIDDNGGIK